MTTTINKRYGCSHPLTATYAEAALSLQEDGLLTEIRHRAQAAGLPDIHVAAADGRHLQVLAAAMGARKAVEVGTLAGYSGTCLLRGMGPTGVLHTVEADPAHAAVARETFARAGLAAQATLHEGKAGDVLPSLERHGPFDLVFLDADKPGYPDYLAWAAQHLRVGGVVLADNVFVWDNIGAADADLDERARHEANRMRQFNATVVASARFVGTLLPTGEGLALGVKLA